ncbi:hypothetical protein chiPu_0026536 [Chiloscyllium punctatum]|uniref:Uncharacterized protein n=1 Tax=Chiloscyllium punctatum TaxID=137246 RepID=A0A401TJF9_CHIPU|nr:hypothetical protein [Chiloscyllium punctatum]
MGASVSLTDLDLPSTHHSISITGAGGSSVVARCSEATLLEIDDILLPVQFWVCPNPEGTILGIDLLGELGAVVDAFYRRLLWMSHKSHKSALEGRWVPTRSVAALAPCVPITRDWTGTVCQLVPEVWATSKQDCSLVRSPPERILGPVHPPHRQYPIQPEALRATETIVAELTSHGVL